MTAKKLLISIKYTGIVLGASGALLLSACQQEILNNGPGNFYSGDPLLEFKGMINDTPGASSRALTQTPVNVEPNEFDGFFYIQVNDPDYHNPDKPEWEGQNLSTFGQYKVPPTGNGGVLEFKGEQEDKPNWYTIDDDHYFWSWTLPWTEAKATKGVEFLTWGDDVDPETGIVKATSRADDIDDDGDDNNGDPNDPNDPDDPNDTPSFTPVDPYQYLNARPIRVKLRDTSAKEFNYRVDTIKDEEGKVIRVEKDSTWIDGSWGNGYFLEKFVGAKSGPYDFRHNGVEVPLQFRHLMSKISLRSLLFQKADGSTDEDIQANITFINMPTEFTLYPHPTQEDYDKEHPTNPYIQVDGPPIVVTNLESANPNGGIMYGFTNPIDMLAELHPDEKVQYRDKFYICPEVDFSKVSFKVEFLDGYHMSKGEYYGDFASVVFEREPGTDYDNPYLDAEGNRVNDATILHAGETMYFDMIVKEYGGGGYSIYVRGWSTRPQQTAKHYTHRGIYVEGEATELIGTSSTWENKFDLYGDGFLDGQNEPPTPSNPGHLGVFHQYNDLDMGNRTSFNLDKNYVLNGMGHLLKFTPGNTTTTTLTIGKMFDVWLEMNGYTVFIDEEGWICTYNEETGKYERNGQQLNLDADKDTFTIDLATGTIK